MSNRLAPPSLLAALGLALVACTPEPIGWELRFTPEGLAGEATHVEAYIIEGGCGVGVVRYRAPIELDTMVAPGGATPLAGDQTYGFGARALDRQCRWYASGCTPLTVPLDEGIVTELTPNAAPVPCGGDDCAGCVPDGGDAGVDAGGDRDGGPTDAGPADGGTDSGLPPTDAGSSPRCGDGECNGDETCASCADCQPPGHGESRPFNEPCSTDDSGAWRCTTLADGPYAGATASQHCDTATGSLAWSVYKLGPSGCASCVCEYAAACEP